MMTSFGCEVPNPWRIQLDAMNDEELGLYFGLIEDAIDKIKE